MSRLYAAQAQQAPQEVLAGIVERVTFHITKRLLSAARQGAGAPGPRDGGGAFRHRRGGGIITATGSGSTTAPTGCIQGAVSKTTPPTTAEGN